MLGSASSGIFRQGSTENQITLGMPQFFFRITEKGERGKIKIRNENQIELRKHVSRDENDKKKGTYYMFMLSILSKEGLSVTFTI